MTEQDRALRALSLKIVDELWGHAKAWIDIGRPLGEPGARSALETFNAASDAAVSRYLPRLPADLPTKAEVMRVLEERPDVLTDPSAFTGFDPKADPILVVAAAIRVHKLPLLMKPDSAFMRIADHYRPLTGDPA